MFQLPPAARPVLPALADRRGASGPRRLQPRRPLPAHTAPARVIGTDRSTPLATEQCRSMIGEVEGGGDKVGRWSPRQRSDPAGL